MKKRNKILFVIMSVVLILSTIVLPVFASSFQENDKLYGSISSQLSSPYSNVGVGDLSIVIEAQGVTYIGDLPQSFTGITKAFAEKIKNPPVNTPTYKTTSSTGLIQCTQVGNTDNKVQFNYTSTYQYTYATEELAHIVYFYLEYGGNRPISNIDKATIIVEDAYTKAESKQWLTVSYNSPYKSENLYRYATELQPPKYKYGGCAQFRTWRNIYGQIERQIKDDMWKENVLSAGTSVVRYSYNYGTTYYNLQTKTTELIPYGFVKYNEIPIYQPNNVNYIAYFDKYEIDPNNMSVIQITDETYADRFYQEAIIATNIVKEEFSNYGNFTNWITEAVNGVLTMRITPYFTIGNLLEVVVVLTLFIAILKIFLGG